VPRPQFGSDIDAIALPSQADIYQSDIGRGGGGERQGAAQRHGTSGDLMSQILQYFGEKQADQSFIFHDQYAKRLAVSPNDQVGGGRLCFIQVSLCEQGFVNRKQRHRFP